MPSVPAEGELAVTIPGDTEAPRRSFSELVVKGTGPTAPDDGVVEIEYSMVSWTSGEVVESTDQFGGSLDVLLGGSGVPEFLQDALAGTPVGSRLMVVFEPNLADLPLYLDQSDAYVLAVDVVGIGG